MFDKKIVLILVVLSFILCSFVFATSDTVQVNDSATNEINVQENNSTVNEINGKINENAVANIYVEYDENDDSVMTVSGGYPVDVYSRSNSVNNPSQESFESVSHYESVDVSEFPAPTYGSCANSA